MNDIRGKEFDVGDLVAYPNRMGSCLWMSLGLVTEVDEEQACLWVRVVKNDDNAWSMSERSYPVTRLERVIIVERSHALPE